MDELLAEIDATAAVSDSSSSVPDEEEEEAASPVPLEEEDLFGDLLDEPVARPVERPRKRKKSKKKTKKKKHSGIRRAHKRARVLASSGDESEASPVPERKSDSEGSEPEPEPEQQQQQDPEQEERTLIVRAHELVSARPPAMLFQTMGTSKIKLLLVGDLVRELSCPLHTFRVKVRPEVGSNALFVTDFLKIMQGPGPKALAVAEDIARATGATKLPPLVISVKVTDLKRAITRSGYFPKATNRSALVAKLLKPLAAAAGKNPLTPSLLDRYVSPDGDGDLHWACRNALATEEFFTLASLVGGRGVKAVGPDNQAAWDVIKGVPDAMEKLSLDDADLDDETILGLLERIHLANSLSLFRANRLHERLEITTTRKREDTAECIVRAAGVYHKLPALGSSTSDDRHRNAIVWGEPGDVWPKPMQDLLKRVGLYVTNQLSNNRWFACRGETRAFYESVTNAVEHGDVRFVRAEEDDNHMDALPGSYIERMRDAVKAYAPNMLIITHYPSRVVYMEDNVSGQGSSVMSSATCGMRSIRQGGVVWIDRAHQFDPAELMRIIRMFAEDALTVHVGGSIWACSTSANDSMFAQLFRQADPTRKETASGTLAEYKAATGRDPVKEREVARKSSILVTRVKGIVVNEDVKAAFRHVRYVTLPELRVTHASEEQSGAVVLLDDNWTCEDLALVWQCVQPSSESIWFVGGKDWKEALRRSSRRASALSALMTQG